MHSRTNRQAAADTLGVHPGLLDAIGLDDRRWQRLQDRLDADHSVTKRHTQETVTAARQLASAARKLDRKAAVAISFWRQQQQRADMDEYLQATRDAKQCRDDLAELLCHDEALIAEVMRRADHPTAAGFQPTCPLIATYRAPRPGGRRRVAGRPPRSCW